MKNYFCDNDVEMMMEVYKSVQDREFTVRCKYLSWNFQNQQAKEYALNGFCRRLEMLAFCINHVFSTIPLNKCKLPSREAILNATMGIQAFFFNISGCIDNLAWIWLYEKNIKNSNNQDINRKNVALHKSPILDSFSIEFQSYIKSRKDWLDHIKDFRDALAHRIPLYIPPFTVDACNAEEYNNFEDQKNIALKYCDLDKYSYANLMQSKIAKFRPWMAHSLNERSKIIVFHIQLLADFATIEEFSGKFMDELGR